MTYSRPSTSPVDALERFSLPNAPSIIGNSQVTRSADGRLMDFRNPQQIVRNGEARAAEVTNFIEGLTKVATPIIKDQLTKQAYSQVGELLKTQDPVQLIRSGNEEQRALVRSLSPQARDLLNDQAAQGSVRMYQETYSAERTKRSAILQSPTASPQEKAAAESAAKGAALDASGLTQMNPQYLMKYGEQLSQTEGLLKGLDYKETLKNQTKNDRAKYVAGVRSMVSRLTSDRVQVAGDPRLADAFVTRMRDGFTNVVREGSQAFSPLEQAEIMAEALQTEVASLTASGDWERASQVVGTLEVLAQSGVKTDAGLNFFDQRLNNGYTLGYVLSNAAQEVDKGYKNWQNEQAFESVKDLMPRALQGEDVNAELLSRMSGMTAQQIMQIAPSMAQLRGIGQQASNQQIIREAELQYQIRGMAPDKAMATLRGALASGQIKAGQFGDLVGRIGKDDPRLAMIDSQRGSLSGEITQSAITIARAAGVTDPEEQREFLRTFNNDVTKAVEKRLADMDSKGEVVNETVVRSVMRNEIEAAQSRRIKDRKQLEELRLQSGPRARVMNEVQELQQNVQSAGGKITMMSFSKGVRVDFQQAHPGRPMTVDNLLRYQADRMKSVPADRDGKPAFDNPQRVLRDMLKQNGAPTNGAGTIYNSLTLQEKLLGKPGAELLNRLMGGGDAPAPSAPSAPSAIKGQEQSRAPSRPAQGPQQAAMRIVGSGLELAAGLITPPAAAATRTEMEGRRSASGVSVENQAAVDTLMRLWRGGQRRVQMNTPPLPQLNAMAPVQMVGTAIQNAMNPFFVAIGISEGTRTAAGGFTRAYYGHRDPGNGVWNVGTVSGQQGGSPATSDRRWMAKLSRTAAGVAPILQQLGLAPGTHGYNRVMFNVLDLMVQAPAAAQDFIRMLPRVARGGFSVEAIAKARTDSFINPGTGRLDAPGFGNSYNRLFQDQRSRAGVWDYKRRI